MFVICLLLLGLVFPPILLMVWGSVMVASFIVGPILMKKEYPGPWPWVTITLILINGVVFAAIALTGISAESYGLRPILLLRGEDLHTPLTSFFIHVDIEHLLGNMLMLLILGFVVERKMGGAKFLLFYLALGLAVSGVDVAIRSDSLIPAFGASGAISGLVGACLIGAIDAKAPLFFLLLLLSPLLAPVSSLLAVFLSTVLFALVILALFDSRFRKSWYVVPFLSIWALSQALLGAIGILTGVHYWAHAVGVAIGLSGWLLMKREKAEEFPTAEVPSIR
jgi:membrane associated rhomboid family serine protease